MINRSIAAYAALSHNRPWTVLGVVIGTSALITAVVMFTGQLSMIETDGEEWLLLQEEMVDRFDAVNLAWSSVPEVAEASGSSLARDTVDESATTTVIYTSVSGNMLTPEGLEAMRQVEETYFSQPEFASMCQLQYADGRSEGCRAPATLLLSSLFSASPWDGDSPGYSLQDLDQEEIDSRLADAAADPDALALLAPLLDKDFAKPCADLEAPLDGCRGVNTKSKYVRSTIFPGGLPLDDWLEKEDLFFNAQSAIISGFTAKVDSELFKLLGMSARPLATPLISQGKIGDVEVVWDNKYLGNADFDATVNGDFAWAVASLVAVFSYMAFHTRSLMVAGIGMLSVVLSFALAIFTTKLIFQVAYLDMMSILVIFVTLGIGADDVFVFVDCFQQSEAVPDVCGTLLDRVTYTLNRSCKAIFVTSLTTAVAFMMTSISDLVNIQAFGIFAGMNIFYLFWLTVLLMPATITIWSRKFSHLPCCVCHPSCPVPWVDRDKIAAQTNSKAQALEARSLKSRMSMKRERGAAVAPTDQEMDMESTGIKAKQGSEEEREFMDPTESQRADSAGLRGVERFFNGRYIAIMQKIKYLVILIFLAIAGLGIFFAMQLQPPADSEDFMPPHHMTTKVKKLLSPSNDYWLSGNSAENEEVYLVWGIRGMDRSGRDKWDPTDRGVIEWDDDWQPFSEAVQTHLMEACGAVSNATCEADTVGCKESEDGTRWLVPHTKDNPKGEVVCWIELMNDWLSMEHNQTLPLPPAEFEPHLRAFHAENPALRYLIGFTEEESGSDGPLTLRFYAQSFTSTFQAPRSSAVTRQVVEDWEAFKDTVNAMDPNNAQAFMSGGYSFVWLYTQESLVTNALVGLALVFALAFVVINIATLNLLVSIITTLTIAGIVVSVLGVGAKGMCNWEFGMAESIATVILIGFSMDYCLHIAGAYIESESQDRVERVRDALTHLGVSVVAGAITTILSGLFLWGTVMVFFQKFAFLITFTVVMSFLWAVLFLPAVLMVIGPEAEFGNWGHMINTCLRRERSTPVERLQ